MIIVRIQNRGFDLLGSQASVCVSGLGSNQSHEDASSPKHSWKEPCSSIWLKIDINFRSFKNIPLRGDGGNSVSNRLVLSA